MATELGEWASGEALPAPPLSVGPTAPSPGKAGWKPPLGVGRVQEWGVKEAGGRCTGRLSAPRDPAAATLIPPAPLHCSPASYLFT